MLLDGCPAHMHSFEMRSRMSILLEIALGLGDKDLEPNHGLSEKERE
jgi:hypothetical protein